MGQQEDNLQFGTVLTNTCMQNMGCLGAKNHAQLSTCVIRAYVMLLDGCSQVGR